LSINEKIVGEKHLPMILNRILSWIAWALFLLTARVRVLGAEQVPRGPYLLLCNHISHFDPPFVSAFYPRKLDFMAMRELFQNRILDVVFRLCDIFPVSRDKPDREAVRVALARLKQGRIVCMFPEGGLRTGEDSVLEGTALKPGAMTLAQMAKVPILPCLVLGTDRYYGWKFWERIDLVLLVGEMLVFAEESKGKNEREELSREVERRLQGLYAEAKRLPFFHAGMIPQTAQERWREAAERKSGSP
jgi:1-acyl-sn-glycerol-3-phosphate acyltransferase